jgi:hypothetical protein
MEEREMELVIGGVGMNGMKSFVPELIQKKGWDTKAFVAHCMLAGMGSDTAYRLARGDTNFKVDTLRQAAAILGVSTISDMIEIEQGQ